MAGTKKPPLPTTEAAVPGARGQGEGHETTLLRGGRLPAFETLPASFVDLFATFFTLADGFR